MIVQQVKQTITDYQMFPADAHILVALSGGADSVALLRVLQALGYTLTAFHLNHCLRGEASFNDAAFVHNLCKTLSIPLICKQEDVANYAMQSKQSIETAARTLRYAHFQDAAMHCGASHIATAHTADDNLETMLFHFIRGTSTRGMAGIPPTRDNIVRPLWNVTRTQVEAYLAALKQDFVTDTTNFTLDYTRNRIRHQVIPTLRALNPACIQAAQRLSKCLQQDDFALQTLALQALPHCNATIAVHCFTQQMPAIRSRMLQHWLSVHGVPLRKITAQHFRQLEQLLTHTGSCTLPDAFYVYHESGMLSVVRHPPCKPIPVGDTFCGRLWHTQTKLTIQRKKEVFHKTCDTFLADCGTIHFGTLVVRPLCPNDRMTLAWTRGARQVKRILNDLHIPQSQRISLAVLADQNGIVAVQSVGVDQSRIPCGNEFLEIRFEGL